MREDVLRVMGEELRLSIDGAGETIVFLHGAGGPNWNRLLQILALQYRVIAPHHPGFARARLPDWLRSVGDLAFFYLDALALLGLERVHLVGHSLGGWTAAELAIRDTRRLATLSLLAPAGVPNAYGDILHWTPDEYAAAQFHDQSLAPARAAAMRATDPEIVRANRAVVTRLAGDPFLHNPQLPVWLHRIDVPTMVLWGESDRICPPGGSRIFASEIPGVRLELIPALGHSVHTERPEVTAAALLGFIGA
jgi:pimeloyl-ACP methyl ester carboxylesterase